MVYVCSGIYVGKQVSIKMTYHVGIAFLGVKLRKAILWGNGLHVGKVGRVHCTVVVPEEESSCVSLINVVVEITAACDR